MANVRKELETIRLKNGGLLTEESIVVAARLKSHPLHDRFTWEDSEAARLWRLEEARKLIRSVYVTIETPKHTNVPVRAYASLPSDREAGGGYRSISSIMSNKKMRAELLLSAVAELDAFKKRYANLSQLAPVFDAIAEVKIKHTFEKERITKKRKAA